MTAYARIITIGKNSDLPRVVSLPIGVGVDGCIFKRQVTIQPDEILCPACQGWGEIECSSNNPSVRNWTERCETCDGNGITEGR